MIRDTPQPGDIGLTSITGAVGQLIRIGQWLNGDGYGAYQHAFIVLPGNRLIEAMPGGAQIVSLDSYADRDVLYVSPVGITDAQRKAVVDNALRYEGVPYSFLDYIALATHRFRIPGPGLRRYIKSTGHMICSQLCDRAYRDAGLQIFADGRWSGYVTPMDLKNELGGNGFTEVLRRLPASKAAEFLAGMAPGRRKS